RGHWPARAEQSHGPLLHHKRRYQYSGRDFPALLSASGNLLRLHGAVYLALPWRRNGEEPALLFPLACTARSSCHWQIPGRMAGFFHHFWLWRVALVHSDVRAFRAGRKQLRVSRSRTRPFGRISRRDGSGVPWLWFGIPGFEPGGKESHSPRSCSAAVGDIPRGASSAAAEVQRDLLSQAAMSGISGADRSHSIVFGGRGTGGSMGCRGWAHCPFSGYPCLRVFAHSTYRNQLSG